MPKISQVFGLRTRLHLPARSKRPQTALSRRRVMRPAVGFQSGPIIPHQTDITLIQPRPMRDHGSMAVSQT